MQNPNSMLNESNAAYRRMARTGYLNITTLMILIIGSLIAVTNLSPELEYAGPLSLFIVFAIVMQIIGVGLIIFNLRRIHTLNETYRVAVDAVVERHDRRANQLQVATQIARDVAHNASLETLLQDATGLIHDRFGYHHAAIYLLNSQMRELVLRAETTADGGVTQPQDMTIPLDDSRVICQVATNGKPNILMDTTTDRTDTQSQMTMPLIVNQQVIGVLDVHCMLPPAFDQADMAILQTLADLLATAIHKARLYQQIHNHAQSLEKRVAERTDELASERAQLQAILDSMNEGVAYLHGDQSRYVNQAFADLLGYTTEQWPGMVALFQTQFLPRAGAEALYRTIQTAVSQKGFWRGDVRLRRQDGTEFEAHMTCTCIAGIAESRDQVMVIRDVSQERALQEQKNRFVANASHELRTPLTNLRTRVYLLKRQPERLGEHVRILQSVIDRMSRLVDDLLDHSRFDRGTIPLKQSVMSVANIIRDVIDVQMPEAQAKGIQLICSEVDTALMSNIDADRMAQVMTNLISNAINYTDSGGTVNVSLRRSGGQVEISVTDTGVGIPEHLVGQVFDPFFRAGNANVKGTGLGLNITRQIVELHGGQISVTSRLNAGTQFRVLLDMAAQSPAG